MLNWIAGIVAGVGAGIVGLVLWHHIFGTSTLRNEIEENERNDAPDDRQLRWDIRHIRQDIIAITRILYLIFIILLIMLIRNFIL